MHHLLFLLFLAGGEITEAAVSAEKEITLEFYYSFTIQELPEDAKEVEIWVPLPRKSPAQEVLATARPPGYDTSRRDKEYGNPMAYKKLPAAEAGSLQIFSFTVKRKLLGPEKEGGKPLPRFLLPDRLVPIQGFIQDVAPRVGVVGSGVQKAKELYRWTLDVMAYDKRGKGWGRGDVRWACTEKYGNCTDFHSLFISLCRVRDIPARFEMGFPLPYDGTEGKISGYHCWAQFHDREKGWMPVDISEADKHPALQDFFFGRLHARRIHFTTGRDITLDPPQAGEPLNYFIYPYVEVDGKPHQKLEKEFSFRIHQDG